MIAFIKNYSLCAMEKRGKEKTNESTEDGSGPGTS